MALFASSLAAAGLSIACSIATAYHRWLLVLWLGLVSNLVWLVVEVLVMMELSNPWSYFPCVIPTIVAEAAAAVGLWRWFHQTV